MGVYKLARGTSPQDAIRFLGCFTDGGCDENQQQYWVSMHSLSLNTHSGPARHCFTTFYTPWAAGGQHVCAKQV